MDKNVDKAREKLEQENIAAGSAKDRVREILLLWLEASPDEAAELILKKEKTVGGAYSTMRENASKNRGQCKLCMHTARGSGRYYLRILWHERCSAEAGAWPLV